MISANARPMTADFGLPAGVTACLQGGLTTGVTGASIGTGVTPGVGTAIGAGAGALIGCVTGALAAPTVPPVYQGYFDYRSALNPPQVPVDTGGAYGAKAGVPWVWIAVGGAGLAAALAAVMLTRRA